MPAEEDIDRRLRSLVPFVRRAVSQLKRRLPPNVDAGDLYTAGMVAAWRTILAHGDLPESQFTAYLTVRVRGALVDELRIENHVGRTQTPPRFVQVDETYLVAPEPEEPDWRAAALVDALRVLPDRERGIVTDHIFGGVKLRDIATRQGCSQPAISQVYARAKRRLRAALG